LPEGFSFGRLGARLHSAITPVLRMGRLSKI
jgi:hypothetical protein